MKIGIIDNHKKTYTPPKTFIGPMAECIMSGTSIEYSTTDFTEEALSNGSSGDWSAPKGFWDEEE